MRPRGRHCPLGSSSLDQPRRLGSLINTTYASAIHTASLLHASSALPSTSIHHAYPELTTTAYAHEEADSESDDEYEDSQDELDHTTSSGEEEEYEEDEDDYYSDDKEDDGQEGQDEEDEEDEHHLYDSTPHLCPHNHHHHLLQHHHPHPLQLHHNSRLLHLDDYDSDDDLDLDMSEDAGTPLVNYLDVANILTADHMDTDSSFSKESDDDMEYSSEIDTEQDRYDESESASISEGESGSEDHDNSQGGNSSVESQFADDASVLTVSQPLTAFFGQPGTGAESIYPHGALLPHAPMPPQAPGDFPNFPDEHGAEAWLAANPNAQTLNPNNHGLTSFLHQWGRQNRMLQGLSRGRSPWPDKVSDLSVSEVTRIRYDNLEGDKCDFQGINWDDLGVSRREARERRLITYSNYTNCAESDRWTPDFPDVVLPRSDNFFRFRRMDIKRDTHLAHFQLRYLLACPSRARFFYPSVHSVVQFNPISLQKRTVIKTGDAPNAQVSAIASDFGVLVSGCFNGEYTIRPLDSPETGSKACRTGSITSDPYGITNHIQLHLGRLSSGPAAVFASNDKAVRVLDIETEKWLSEDEFEFPVNCTAISPDKRLRAVVGDNKNLLITAAESTLEGNKPEIFYDLKGHRDFGFAVDWADDGWTIASAFQDRTIRIWDARCLTNSSGESKSVTTIRTEMAGARNLKFSPIGSGKRCLIAAEEADYVNIIDARTFRTKQTVDFFGEIGGVSFANEGQDLVVLCCDPHRGGIMQFERCGLAGADFYIDPDELDWPPSLFTDEKRRRHSGGRPRYGGHSSTRSWERPFGDIEPF
ncbi:WD40-repeat-containing domain protein [Cladorrhinum sp. PSN332]|nr:WD40-repeat-containing domain protein [Cladorrhinum sp. PSN332]